MHSSNKGNVSYLSIKWKKSEIDFTFGYPTMPLYPQCHTNMWHTDPTIFGKRQVIEILHAVIP